MENVRVTYLSTELISIDDNIKIDSEREASHYTYLYPNLKIDLLGKSATFGIDIQSQFEYSRVGVPYGLCTRSHFLFENFIPDDDRFVVLEDYLLFAYRKHVLTLKEKLPYHGYVCRVRNDVQLYQYKNSLEMILYFAARDMRKSA